MAASSARAVAAGALDRLDEQRVARGEVGVEAAVRQPGLAHDVGHTHALVAGAADGASGCLDDAIVAELFPARRGLHDDPHIDRKSVV